MTKTNVQLKSVWNSHMNEASGKSAFGKSIILTFGAVAVGLLWIAKKLHLTYNEINVLVYYWLIPATWALLLDYKIGAILDMPIYHGFMPALTIALCCAWIGILVATSDFFSKWCDYIFQKSQAFLCIFNQFGGNYILNSVIICVIVPLIIYLLFFFI